MWMLLKTVPCLWTVYVAGCVSVLCMCASLAYMLIFATGRACKQESNSCIHWPKTEGPPGLWVHWTGLQQLGRRILRPQSPPEEVPFIHSLTKKMSQKFWWMLWSCSEDAQKTNVTHSQPTGNSNILTTSVMVMLSVLSLDSVWWIKSSSFPFEYVLLNMGVFLLLRWEDGR